MEKNVLIIFKIILVFLLLALIILYVRNNRGNINDIEINNSVKQFNEIEICSRITGTPSWVDNNMTILKSGYLEVPQEKQKEFIQSLISNKIHFVYASGCGWCAKQIEDMGESLFNYYRGYNLTTDCMEVIK